MLNNPVVDSAARIQQLRQLLRAYNYDYYVLNNARVSDAKYDQLLRELECLEAASDAPIPADSPTQTVGAPPSSAFAEVRHGMAMLSLANAFNDEEIAAFLQRAQSILAHPPTSIIAEPKIDGLAINLRYLDGYLVQAATRGDGVHGEDITHNARHIDGIPLHLADPRLPSELEIRGEVYMPKATLQALNQQREANGEKALANPRNAAAGSLRQLDPKVSAARGLCFFAYGAGLGGSGLADTQSGLFSCLQQLGFAVQDYRCMDSFEAMLAWYREFLAQRDQMAYEVDGMVFKLNDYSEQQALGEIARSPRWAIAYKFPAQEVTTLLQDIIWQVGRTGVITPVAVMDSVAVGGVQVTRATLHNIDELRRKDVRPGDRVWVRRAGDVIPEVVGRVVDDEAERQAEVDIPRCCPVCSSDVVREEGEAAIRCTGGMRCQAQLIEGLRHFVARAAMDIDGLGEKMLLRLIEQGLLHAPADLYTLDWRSLQTQQGLGVKSIEKLMDAVERSRQRPLPQLLFALGIRHVGQRTALTLAEHFGSLDGLAAASEESLQALPDIGPEVSRSLRSFFDDPQQQVWLKALCQQLDTPDYPVHAAKGNNEHPLFGQTVVLSGSFSEVSRQQASSRLRELGVKVSSAVSAKTDVLIAGEKAGSKLRKAQTLGVDIADEVALMKWLEK